MSTDQKMWLWIDSPRRAAALALALALVISMLVGFYILPIWRLYSIVPNERLRSDRLRVTHELATTWRRASPDILFIGGSQVRELLPSDEFVGSQLSASCGRPIRVFNAASSAQLLETSWSIADRFASSPPRLVVVGTGIWRILDGSRKAEALGQTLFLLPAPSNLPTGIQWIRTAPGSRLRSQLGVAFTDLRLAVRSERPTVSIPTAFDGTQHAYRGEGWTVERKLIDSRSLAIDLHRVDPSLMARNIEAYDSFGAVMSARGSQVAWILTPNSPETNHVLANVDAKMGPAIEKLQGRGKVVDLEASTDLESEDFFDSVHLRASGREKLWPKLKSIMLHELDVCRAKAESP